MRLALRQPIIRPHAVGNCHAFARLADALELVYRSARLMVTRFPSTAQATSFLHSSIKAAHASAQSLHSF